MEGRYLSGIFTTYRDPSTRRALFVVRYWTVEDFDEKCCGVRRWYYAKQVRAPDVPFAKLTDPNP